MNKKSSGGYRGPKANAAWSISGPSLLGSRVLLAVIEVKKGQDLGAILPDVDKGVPPFVERGKILARVLRFLNRLFQRA
jgi:hypothetical protein